MLLVYKLAVLNSGMILEWAPSLQKNVYWSTVCCVTLVVVSHILFTASL